MGRYRAVWSSLDLTDEQRDKLFTLQQRLKKTFFDAEAAKEEATYALQSGLAADVLAEDALGASADAAADAEKQLLHARIDFVKEMRAILTPEQVQKLHEQMRILARDARGRVRSRRFQ